MDLLIWIIYGLSFSLILSSGCSRSDHRVRFLYDDRVEREVPSKMAIYQAKIITWLRRHLSDSEISNINFETINRSGEIIPDRPIFKDRKLLFKLAERLFKTGLNELGSEVLQFIRSRIFFHSTYAVLIASLYVGKSADNLIIFHQVLKLWLPKSSDIILAIVNVVDLRMGEDEAIILIDLVWDNLLLNVADKKLLYFYFSRILRIAMRNHYVSVFEDILDRFHDMINFTNLRSRGVGGGTIVHEFCHNLSPILLNQCHDRRSPSDLSESGDPDPIDHKIRSYPTANVDLLNLMKLHAADIEERDRNGMTPLHLAIYLRNHHIIDVLLRSGADYNAKYSKYSMKEWIKRHQVEQVFEEFLEATMANESK